MAASASQSNLFQNLFFLMSPKIQKDESLYKEMKALIQSNDGTTTGSLAKRTTHFVALPADVEACLSTYRKCKERDDVFIVSPDFVRDSIRLCSRQDEMNYQVSWLPPGTDATTSASDSKRKVDEMEISDTEDSAKKPKTVEEETPNLVTRIKKGNAVVDEYFPHAKFCHVYEENGVVYDCMLNQTEIGRNANKFYKIQLMKHDEERKFWVWNRWGRVGVKGQSSILPFGTAAAAIQNFTAKFKDKTRNNWEDRHNFVKVEGKYHYIEMDYGAEQQPDSEDDTPKPTTEDLMKIPDSTLEKPVQDLVKMIFDVETMKKEMTEIGYDAKKMPLGKIKQKHITEGFEILDKLSQVLVSRPENVRSLIDRYSSDFYTLIPHDFGRQHPPSIKTMKHLKEKIQMLEALSEIRIASKLIKSMQGNFEKNILDLHYESLHCELKPIRPDSEVFDMIKMYARNTHGITHNQYSLEVLEVFDVSRQGESELYEKGMGGIIKTNRQLLWHGSRISNYAGILSQGLRIAPPEAPVTGYMFGKGVYFANMVSKSANYCCTNASSDIGLMLLCEVALGDENQLREADGNAGALARSMNKHSTKGCGKTYPDPEVYKEIDGGVKVPLGPAKTDSKATGALLYDEFIVYDTSQVKLKYLVKMRFNYKRGYLYN